MSLELMRICGLWKGEDKNGNLVLSGTLNGNVRVMVFANIYKKEVKQPDFILYYGPHGEFKTQQETAEQAKIQANEETPF